jgi:hypothetical protein
MNMKAKLLALAGIASAVLWASTANSATLSIGLVAGAGAPALVAGPSVGSVNFTSLANFGVFTANDVSATGRPITPLPNILGSTSLNIASSGPGTLRVYVTSQGNTDASNAWISTFTSNSLPTGWLVTEQTFLDPNNGLFTTPIQLGSAVFNAIGTSVASALAASGNNYSVTHLYTIVATGAGLALSTINLQTPIPGALPLFATGLLGLWALRRKRKTAPAKSLDPVVA